MVLYIYKVIKYTSEIRIHVSDITIQKRWYPNDIKIRDGYEFLRFRLFVTVNGYLDCKM